MAMICRIARRNFTCCLLVMMVGTLTNSVPNQFYNDPTHTCTYIMIHEHILVHALLINVHFLIETQP